MRRTGAGAGGWGRMDSGIQGDEANESRMTSATRSMFLSTKSATSPEYFLMSLGMDDNYSDQSMRQ